MNINELHYCQVLQTISYVTNETCFQQMKLDLHVLSTYMAR